MTITITEDRATQDSQAPAAAPPRDFAREDVSRGVAPADPAAPTAKDAAGSYRAVLSCTYQPRSD